MQEEVRSRPFADFMPSRWSVESDDTVLWVSCYQVVFGDKAMLAPDGFTSVDLGDAIVLVINAALAYQYVSPMAIKSSTPARQIFLEPIHGEERRLEQDLYLLIVTPVTAPGIRADEPALRSRVAEIAGIATIRLGRNALFVHRYDNQICLAKSEASASTPALKSPGDEAPRIDAASLQQLSLLDAAIKAVDGPTRERLGLAIRWYDASFRASEPIDDFLAAWFAVEAADGSGDRVVSSINRRLASAHGITERDATTEFQIGKVFNLRGQIAHEGLRPAIHADLLAYLQHVFLDVVDHVLGQPALGHTRSAMTLAAEHPSRWLPNFA